MTLYVATLESRYNDELGNPFSNVFTFDVADVLPSSIVASNLAEEIWNNYVSDAGGWKAIVSAKMDADRVVVLSPFDPTVLGIYTGAVAGTRSSAAMPKWIAWSFKSERKRADIRAGFKRFGAVAEADITDGLPATGLLTILDTFATIMNTPFLVSDGIDNVEARQVIVKRIPIVVDGETVGYRMPEDPLEYEYAIAEWAFQEVSNQNTRKSG